MRFKSEADVLEEDLSLGRRQEYLDQGEQLASLEAIEVESAVERVKSGRVEIK